jgi:hypothetical protein
LQRQNGSKQSPLGKCFLPWRDGAVFFHLVLIKTVGCLY